MKAIQYCKTVLARLLIIILILWGYNTLSKSHHHPIHYSRSDFLWDGKKPHPPRYIAKGEAEKEINQLIYILENVYIGYTCFPDAVKHAIQALKNLKLKDKVAVENFYEQLATIFKTIPDQHATVHLIGRKKEKRSAPSHNLNTTNHPWLVELREEGDHQVLLIAITSFPPFSSTLWEGFLACIKEKLPQCSSIILDLRGNQGGDDRMGRQLATLLYGSEKWPYPVSKILRHHTWETYIMRANNIKLKIRRLQQQEIDTSQLEKEYQDLIQEAGSIPHQVSDTRYVIDMCISNPLPTTSLPLPIIVLIDRACGSSGENMIDFLEAHPYLLTIGESTHGAIHFGNMGLFFLPYSKLMITLGTQFKAYHDERMIEGIGITPMYQVSSEKAYEAALARLAKP